jgi:vancomycin aglycone glucosyltransferase
MHPPFLVPAQSMPRWANRLAWRATHMLFGSVIRPFVNAQRATFGLPPIEDIVPYILTQRPVVAADEELAPLPRDCPSGVRQIRALQPPPGEPLPAKLESFLEQGPPPVYLGFGSMTDARPDRTTREIMRAVAAIGCRALVSRGWAGLGGETLPEGVLEIDAVCHAQLFPRVAAVVHHGGAGTTTAAARAGVPQILVPHLMDQFYWGRRVQLLGLGPPPLARKRLRADRLAAALEATLENELLAERAREVGERLRTRNAIDTSAVLAD